MVSVGIIDWMLTHHRRGTAQPSLHDFLPGVVAVNPEGGKIARAQATAGKRSRRNADRSSEGRPSSSHSESSRPTTGPMAKP